MNIYEKKQGKLIMTLLVRDEIDIIETNIKFHLAHGVDFIIATDNASIDGTRDILIKYRKKGVLHLIDEPTKDYSQAKWVNRMGKIAFEKYNADFVFHCDADEFWYSKNGNLKKEISECTKNVMLVGVINVLLTDRKGCEQFPMDTKYAVVNPIIASGRQWKKRSKDTNFYLFKYPPKVFLKKYFEVIGGNHDIKFKYFAYFNKYSSRDIIIYHYPIRSKQHFTQKIFNGGSSYSANNTLKKSVGWHWRMWYDSYNNDSLDKEYKKLLLNKTLKRKLVNEQTIERIDFLPNKYK